MTAYIQHFYGALLPIQTITPLVTKFYQERNALDELEGELIEDILESELIHQICPSHPDITYEYMLHHKKGRHRVAVILKAHCKNAYSSHQEFAWSNVNIDVNPPTPELIQQIQSFIQDNFGVSAQVKECTLLTSYAC